MHVYQFMPAAFALQSVEARRLKVSRLDDLNDPFELLGASLPSAAHRSQLGAWRRSVAQTRRVLCFSRTYTNPLMWSHYADKHRGMCLRFLASDDVVRPVSYASARLESNFLDEISRNGAVSSATTDRLLTTKFEDWRYEREVRIFVNPAVTKRENGLGFVSFEQAGLKLDAVYVGARCSVTEAEIRRGLHPSDRAVLVLATRLAFKSFRVLRTPWRGHVTSLRDS